MKKHSRQEFPAQVIDALARRASFICSNPDCRSMTLAPATNDPEKFLYVGVAAHLTAAAPGGPRYDPELTPDQRGSINNAIFLCSNCSVMVDKNNGIDFPLCELTRWKNDHENWVRDNLNKSYGESDAQRSTIGPNAPINGSVIISHNQSGGQVAHSITNIGVQPRRIPDESLTQLSKLLRNYPPQDVDLLVANDGEAKNLAMQLEKAFVAGGWTIAGHLTSLAPTGTGVIVGVLRGEEEKPLWQDLGNWIANTGLHFTGEILDSTKSRPMIYVALNPL